MCLLIQNLLLFRVMLVRSVLVFACLTLLATSVFASEVAPIKSGGCGDSDQAVGNCSVHFHVCAGFFKWHWKYDADASASGKSGHSHHDDSKDGAAKNALVDLFANQLTQGDCSCTVSTIPVGKCPIRFSVCFMFNDTGCVDRHAPSFNAWAHNTVTNKEGSVRRYADPKQAGTDALTALFVGSPGDKAVCFPPEYDVVDTDLSNALNDLNVPSL